jgi:predicted lipoprotein with Yx(FWY)xxD motif
MRNRWLAAPLLGAGAALLVACGSTSPPASSSTHNPPASQAGANTSTVTIMTHSTSKGTVLATVKGKTIYWFANDTSTTSNCTGSCTSYWPPVLGKPVAAAGTSLPKGFGTITRSSGQTQATYDGHPLYTYSGDTAAGMIAGNDLNESGGLWYAMTPSGAMLSAAPSSSSTTSPPSSSGSGGYGY